MYFGHLLIWKRLMIQFSGYYVGNVIYAICPLFRMYICLVAKGRGYTVVPWAPLTSRRRWPGAGSTVAIC